MSEDNPWLRIPPAIPITKIRSLLVIFRKPICIVDTHHLVCLNIPPVSSEQKCFTGSRVFPCSGHVLKYRTRPMNA